MNIDMQFDYTLSAGRSAITRSSYGEALRFFRTALSLSDEDIPHFFSHRELLNDFGKAYQYAAPSEGIKLFLGWEKKLAETEKLPGLTADNIQEIRYRLFYFAGRMARQAKRPKDAIANFRQAIKLAPDLRQKDASIWYLLDTTFGEKEENFVAAVKEYAAEWDDGAYFSDVLDKFSAWASRKRRWDLLGTVFFEVKDYADVETRSKYAYMCGRALEHGLASKKDIGETAAYFYKFAYDSAVPQKASMPSFYYRALAAERLERPLDFDLFFPELPPDATTSQEHAEVPLYFQFINGFFRFGAAAFAYPYIRELREQLTIEELRETAENLFEAKQWQSLINVTLYYIRREDCDLVKRDLELCFPLGHQTLIERYADMSGIKQALLFALVRRESVFNANAVSRVGALGLTQLMERTGTEMARILARSGGPDYFDLHESPLLDPEVNTHLGALYYKQLFDMTKSPVLAILAYNGGIGNIRNWKRSAADLPDDLFLETVQFTETRTYGRGVLGDELVYTFLYTQAE